MKNNVLDDPRFRTKRLQKWKKHCLKIEGFGICVFPYVSKSCIHKILTDHLGMPRPANLRLGILGLHCHRRPDLGSLSDTGNERTITSVKTSGIVEAMVPTNTANRESVGECFLGHEGVIVVRFHTCRYNNQCRPLL
ncbi:hypothetical protein TNIN_30091 [Trichonephila inaurata madagascariensis]|uniref:Uncharacterized protein n=1 Tax=Trichonephila inaurata madagascariensis TaxID=2747483 RepID=A0A8X7CCR8_9ARAC|nr:hypothetical protein TNIN_30091 [Trichonephila inaurata madagascariensis]